MAIPKEYAKYLSLGTEIAVSFVVPILIGYGIDFYFETRPIFILIGCAAGLLWFFSLIMRLSKDINHTNDHEDV